MYSTFVVLAIFGILARFMYLQHKEQEALYESHNHYLLVAQYYIGTTSMHKRKPILWIHTQTDVNARHWESFGSRNTRKLNQPYLFITMKSIYDQCKDSFNICVINDDSFHHLLTDWDESLGRTIGLAKLLYVYGGLVVPQSFLCVQDLLPFSKHDLFVAEGFTTSTARTKFAPNTAFMACKRNAPVMNTFILLLERIHKQQSNQHRFQDTVGKWLRKHAFVLDGVKIGIKRTDGDPVTVGDLLGTTHIPISSNVYGLLLPQQDLLDRTKYNWFARMSVDQILNSDMMVARYILASH